MGIVRWNPWSDLDVLHDELDRTFRRATNGAQSFAPATDVHESEAGFELAVDLPGVKLDDVRIEVADRVLKIEGERRSAKTTEGKGYRRTERAFGSFSRSFTLGAGIDEAGIAAKMSDGVLHVTLPKKAEVQPRRVTIEA